MKANKNVLIAIAASVAVVGFASIFFTTGKGKKITTAWKKKGKEAREKMNEKISDAREKFTAFKKEKYREESPGAFSVTDYQ